MKKQIVTFCMCSLMFFVGSCAGETEERVIFPQHISAGWAKLLHRISVMEVASLPHNGFLDFYAQLNGGSFGVIDVPYVELVYITFESRFVRKTTLSVELTISHSSQKVEQQKANTVIVLDAKAGEVPVVIPTGFRISTDEYSSNISFQIPAGYDPAEGFTTQGFGVYVKGPFYSPDGITAVVEARISMGPSDRSDMNKALTMAYSWVKVNLEVVYLKGDVSVTWEEVYYTTGATTYGRLTSISLPPRNARTIILEGREGYDMVVFAIKGFDFWINDGVHMPDWCVVVQDELNFLNEPVSGPARYLRSFTAAISEAEYFPENGTARVVIDALITNSSQFKEVGNICEGVRVEVLMVQIKSGYGNTAGPFYIRRELTPGRRFFERIYFE